MGLFDFVEEAAHGGINIATGALHHVQDAEHRVVGAVQNAEQTVQHTLTNEAGVIVSGVTNTGRTVVSEAGKVISATPSVLSSVSSEVTKIAAGGLAGAEQGVKDITSSNLFKWVFTPHYPSLPGDPVVPLTWDGLFSTQNIILGAAGVGVGLFVLDRVAKIV